MTEVEVAALITVCGMVAVALIQVLITNSILRSERKNLRDQIWQESLSRRRDNWEVELRDSLATLVTLADPEVNIAFQNRNEIVRLIHKIDFLLSRDIPEHNLLRTATAHLAMEANGWRSAPDASRLLGHIQEISRIAAPVLRSPTLEPGIPP